MTEILRCSQNKKGGSMRRGPKALARVSESAGGFRQMYLGAPLAMPPMVVRSRLIAHWRRCRRRPRPVLNGSITRKNHKKSQKIYLSVFDLWVPVYLCHEPDLGLPHWFLGVGRTQSQNTTVCVRPTPKNQRGSTCRLSAGTHMGLVLNGSVTRTFAPRTEGGTRIPAAVCSVYHLP